jgi:hypothetical protein
MAERRVKDYEAQQAMLDNRIKEVASSGGPASEIADAKRLLDSGAINQTEFDQIKQRALAAA